MRKKKILIADDDPAICESIKMILEDEGYKVDTTTDGDTVLDVYQNNPDLILLDIWMSGVDGRDVCRDLKSKKETKDTPVIIFSANKNIKEIALSCGADGFIAKPFEMQELLQTVGSHIHT